MTECRLLAGRALSPLLAPQQTGIQVIEICAGVLLLLALLTLLVGWMRRLAWGVRISALLPLAASIGAGIAAHALEDTYRSWVHVLCSLPRSFPPAFRDHVLSGIVAANQTAAALGWASAIVTGILLVLSGVGLWRLSVRGEVAA